MYTSGPLHGSGPRSSNAHSPIETGVKNCVSRRFPVIFEAFCGEAGMAKAHHELGWRAIVNDVDPRKPKFSGDFEPMKKTKGPNVTLFDGRFGELEHREILKWVT